MTTASCDSSCVDVVCSSDPLTALCSSPPLLVMVSGDKMPSVMRCSKRMMEAVLWTVALPLTWPHVRRGSCTVGDPGSQPRTMVVDGCRARTRDGVRFHHAAQEGAQFKTCELLISGTFHLIFFLPRRTVQLKPRKGETAENGGMLRGQYVHQTDFNG